MRQIRLVTYLLLLLLTSPAVSLAATNAVTAGIGGVDNATLLGGDGSGAARVTITAASLPLVKQARDPAGNVIAAGGSVAQGEVISFALLVTNPTAFAVTDVQISDQLNEAEFTYIPDSLETTSIAAGTNNAALWAAVWSPLTDDPGGPDDSASIVNSGGPAGRDRLTIGAVAGQANQTISLPANTTLAIRFRVRVN